MKTTSTRFGALVLSWSGLALIGACAGGSASKTDAPSPVIDDGPKVNRLEATIAMSMAAEGDGVLCPGSFQRVRLTAFDDPKNDSWGPSPMFYEVTSTPPVKIEPGDDGLMSVFSPMPASPQYAGMPVTLTFTYLPAQEEGLPVPPKGPTTQIVIPQDLTCGDRAAINLEGEEGPAGVEGDVGRDGGKGGDGKPGRAAEVEAADVVVNGMSAVLVIARVEGDDELRVAVLPVNDTPLFLHTAGGSGGSGGRGGRGRPGYDDDGNCRTPGVGGDGGQGGNGGDGANLTVRASSSVILKRFNMGAKGGFAGSKGEGGLGGAPCNDSSNDGKRGNDGRPGEKGSREGKVTTKVVAARELGMIGTYLAQYPAFTLVGP